MGRKPHSSKITVDMKKNRLVVTLVGIIRKKELEHLYTEIRFGVQDLQPGFHVVTDMRECKIGYLSGAMTFKKIMEFLISQKVGKVIRITGKSRILYHQISRISKTITGYSPVYVSSMEEAEEALAGKD